MDDQSKSPITLTHVLVGLVIVAAFLIGVLWTKVQFLEGKGGPSVAGTTSVVSPNASPTIPPQTQPQIVPPTGKVKPVSDSDHIRGNKNAQVTLVEFSDLECPFCKQFHPTMQQALKEYDGKIRWVYRHFPLSFHANAQKEAEATECVASLGGNDKFWEFVDKIFERTTSNGTGFPLDKLGPLAQEVGVNQTEFQQCLDSGKFTKLVQDQMADGASGGITGTPGTIVIDGKGNIKLIPGALPYEQVKPIIEEALKP